MHLPSPSVLTVALREKSHHLPHFIIKEEMGSERLTHLTAVTEQRKQQSQDLMMAPDQIGKQVS